MEVLVRLPSYSPPVSCEPSKGRNSIELSIWSKMSGLLVSIMLLNLASIDELKAAYFDPPLKHARIFSPDLLTMISWWV